MSTFPLRVIGAFPSLDTYRKILEEFAELGSGRVCTLDAALGGKIRELTEPHLDLVFSSPVEIASTQLLVANQTPPTVAAPKQVAEFVRCLIRSSANLGPFNSVKRFPGFQRRINGALSELRHWRFQTKDFYQESSQIDPISTQKFQALAELSTKLELAVSTAKFELEESVFEKVLQLTPTKSAAPFRVLVFAGSDVSPLHRDWIKKCEALGAIVWAVVPISSKIPQLWTGAQQFSSEVQSLIEESGEVPELVREFCQIPNHSVSQMKVKIESAADHLSECEWAIRRAIVDIENGIPASHIGIFTRDLQSYGPSLSAAAERLGVQLNLPQNVGLLTSQFAKWALQIFKALHGNTVRPLVELVESPYALVPEESLSEVKGAILDSQKAGSNSWSKLEHQQELLPFWIEEIIQIRNSSISESKTLREWNSVLYELVQIEPMKFIAEHEGTTYRREKAALVEMNESFSRHVFADIDGAQFTYPEFIAELEQIWSMATIEIGRSASGIEVANSPLALLGKKSIHALGFLEGMFPRRRAEDPILSDWERANLVTVLGSRKLQTSDSIGRSELELFLTLLGAASQSITLSYPTTNDDRDNIPAFYLSQLSDALEGRIIKTHNPQAKWCPDAENCIAESDKRLNEALSTPRPNKPSELVSDPANLEAIRTSQDDRFSIYDLRCSSRCSFQFAAQSQLNLRNLASKRLSNRIPMMEYLPQAESEDAAKAMLNQAWKLRLEELSLEFSEEEIALADASARRRISNAVNSEFNARKIWKKDSGSIQFAVDFEDGKVLGEIRLSEKENLKLSGKISALSKMGPYQVAHVFHARKAFFEKTEDWTDEECLEVGVHFAVLGNRGEGTAIEFSTDDGEKLLVCNEIIPGCQPPGNVKENLRVVSLNAKESKFMPKVGQIIRTAVQTSRTHSMEVSPGDQCKNCEFGELCRRSSEFGELADLMVENE